MDSDQDIIYFDSVNQVYYMPKILEIRGKNIQYKKYIIFRSSKSGFYA